MAVAAQHLPPLVKRNPCIPVPAGEGPAGSNTTGTPLSSLATAVSAASFGALSLDSMSARDMSPTPAPPNTPHERSPSPSYPRSGVVIPPPSYPRRGVVIPPLRYHEEWDGRAQDHTPPPLPTYALEPQQEANMCIHVAQNTPGAPPGEVIAQLVHHVQCLVADVRCYSFISASVVEHVTGIHSKTSALCKSAQINFSSIRGTYRCMSDALNPIQEQVSRWQTYLGQSYLPDTFTDATQKIINCIERLFSFSFCLHDILGDAEHLFRELHEVRILLCSVTDLPNPACLDAIKDTQRAVQKKFEIKHEETTPFPDEKIAWRYVKPKVEAVYEKMFHLRVYFNREAPAIFRALGIFRSMLYGESVDVPRLAEGRCGPLLRQAIYEPFSYIGLLEPTRDTPLLSMLQDMVEEELSIPDDLPSAPIEEEDC